MNESKSAKNKRKKTGNNNRSDKKKDKQVNPKPEGDQTENDKIETAENSEVALSCSATESNKDDGNSRTSKKNNETSASEPEIICKMEDSSGSCDFKTSTDDKHVDNKEVKTSSQTTEANGASSSDSKVDCERQTALTNANQKMKKSEPASSTQTKPNEIREYSRGTKQSVKVDMKDQHFSKVGQLSSMRSSGFRQDKHHENSEVALSCSASESNKDDGDSRTSKKNNATRVNEPETICKMEDSSGSCDFKTSTVDNKEVKTSSQTTEANGASSSDSKADGERQPALTKASQKIKKSEPASSTQTKPNEIRGYLRGAKQSVKVDMKDQHFSKVGQWSSLRGSSFRQDKHHNVVQSNARGYVRRAHSAEKSLDPSFHSAYFNLSGKRDNFHFFFKRQSPFSQHFMSEFEVDEVKYNCCEQFMMQQKALTFKDEDSAKRIMATTEPNVQKRFGRQVKNFDGEVWNRVCMEVVKKGNLAKFSQNPKLKETLLKTGSKVLVEASPYDRIWGIGLDQDHADAPFPEHWLGENRLGRILMEVRDELSKELKPK